MVKKVEIINLIIVFINIKFIIENLMECTLIIKLFFNIILLLFSFTSKGKFSKRKWEKGKDNGKGGGFERVFEK
jgi:hypothetical protein